MIKFNKPVNLNGSELKNELKNVGIEMNDDPFVDGNGDFWLDVKDSDKATAQAIVAQHNGTIVPKEISIEEKLSSVGLNINDLKKALGLG